jgi:hypothetical protein
VLETPSCEVDDVWTAELAVLRASSARAHPFEDASAPLDAEAVTKADADSAGCPRAIVAKIRERVATTADAVGAGADMLVTHALLLREVVGPARAASEKGGKTKAGARRGVLQSAAAAAKTFNHEAAVKGYEVENENGEESELTAVVCLLSVLVRFWLAAGTRRNLHVLVSDEDASIGANPLRIT